MPKWLKIVAVIGVVIIAAKFGPQLFGGSGGGGWSIQQEQDKLTDVVETIATRVYPTDDGGQIDVTVKCLPEPGFPPIRFEFAHFAKGETGKHGDKESAYEYNTSDYRGPVLVTEYRLDDQPVQKGISPSQYQNQALLYLDRDLVLVKLMRVQLPLQHGFQANLEIHPADLRELFVSCPSTKELLESLESKDASVRPVIAVASAPASQLGASPETGPPQPDTGEFTAKKYMAMHPENRDAEARMTAPIGSETAAASANPEQSSPPSTEATASPSATPPEAGTTQAAVPTAPAVPSINCAAPIKPIIDVLVCSSPQLVSTDAQINVAYYQLRHSLAPDAAAFLKEYQKDWLAKRGENCGLKLGDIGDEESARLVSCLQDLYTNRLNALQAQLRGAQ